MAFAYTRRFAAAVVPTNLATTVFTADDLHVYIIRDVILTNQSGADSFVVVNIILGTNTFTLMRQTVLAVGAQIHLETRQEMLPSEQLVVYAPNAQLSILVTGYALDPQ